MIATASARGGAAMALGLSRYTDDLRLLVTADDTELDRKMLDRLEDKAIAVVDGDIEQMVGAPGKLEALRLAGGATLEA